MRHTRVRGARTHNLQAVDLDLAPGEMVAIVGPSGAGKSSLAFGTLYAEGQRRYVESFSAYARQFLERLPRPPVQELGPVPAGIAVDRQGAIRTSRSTVGTLTDVAEYGRSLWACAARPVCPEHGQTARERGAEALADGLLEDHGDARILVSYRLPVPEPEDFVGLREQLASDGYRRVRIAEAVRDLDEVRPSDLPVGDDGAPPAFEVVVDRLRVSRRDRARLVEALEVALVRGERRATVTLETGEDVQLSSALACPVCAREFAAPRPGMFSFNSPLGACPTCRGFGSVMAIDWDKVLPDPSRTLARGAIAAWRGKSTARERRFLARCAEEAGVPMDTPLGRLSDAQRDWLVEGDGASWWGLRGWFEWLQGRAYKMHVRVLLARYRMYETCPDCAGTRFQPVALHYQVRGVCIAELLAMPVSEALDFVRELEGSDAIPGVSGEESPAELLRRECETRLTTLMDVGLGYLGLYRAGNTLSGGETQRVALASALGSSLTGAMFVLDEPTVGLHPRDVTSLGRVIQKLRDAGNMVLMVEHELQLVRAADRVIELGPSAGEQGGQVVFDGTPAQLARRRTPTGLALRASSVAQREPRELGDWLKLRGARGHNLQGDDLEIPRGGLSCILGVSGSGKSTLVRHTLAPALRRALGEHGVRPLDCDALEGFEGLGEVVFVDQSPLVRTSRGNPATYSGAWDVVRRRFAALPEAREAGYKPGFFSFNVAGGRCEVCKGQGHETVEMQFLADVTFSCASCGGKRFVGPVLQLQWQGLDVASWLVQTVDAALERHQDDREISARLGPLQQVGLGYLGLGQPLNTLSGGEAQRLKLAQALAETRPGGILLLDEPTAGLHPGDLPPLLAALDALVERGDTVLVVEHEMRVAAHADHVVELGPGAGAQGGRIIATGPPAQIAQGQSPSAPYLRELLDPGVVAQPAAGRRKAGRRRRASEVPDIHLLGAREHNLRGLDVRVPVGKLVAVTGPSGSGKSSLAFGVIHAEGQRRFLETLSPYARQYLPQLPRPDVDRASGIPPTVSLEQRLNRGAATSTVATLTEVAHFLRLLYARVGVSPEQGVLGAGLHGAAELASRLRKKFGRRARLQVFAPVIQGRKGLHRDLLTRARDAGIQDARIDGEITTISEGLALDRYREHDIDLLVGKLRSGDEDLPATLQVAADRAEGEVRVLVRKKDLLFSLRDEARQGSGTTATLDPRLFSFNTRQGACAACEGKGLVTCTVGRGKSAQEVVQTCSECGGSRLSSLARSVRVQGEDITYYLGCSVKRARERLADLKLNGRDGALGGPLLEELHARLGFLERVGLGYLGLDRSADSLSGGETQRVRLAAQLGSGLTGVLYVLDEPTIGLHARDTGLLIEALRSLVERGNGVLVVEHDAEVIGAADEVLDMGPGGGRHGGSVVARGTPAQLASSPSSVTGPSLARPVAVPGERRALEGLPWVELKGARAHNLAGADVRLPAGRLTVVTGVSGSGKSTLVRRVLLPAVRQVLGLQTDEPGVFSKLKGAEVFKRAVEVDQTPIGRTPRSVPATYVGIWDLIRKLLAGVPDARARGYGASRFSFNVKGGRCAACDGNGVLNVEMPFLPDALLPCEECAGQRFGRETLSVELHGLNAGQILDLEVAEAARVFSGFSKLAGPLELLDALGLGYLKLGQPSSTLSGGEAQRLKLVAELSRASSAGPTLYVLDEPTTGLHREDVVRLTSLIDRFVERGDTVVVIEHHPDVMAAADWLIDLGPEAGDEGGRVVGQGTPEQLAALAVSHTGKLLKREFRRAGRRPVRRRRRSADSGGVSIES